MQNLKLLVAGIALIFLGGCGGVTLSEKTDFCETVYERQYHEESKYNVGLLTTIEDGKFYRKDCMIINEAGAIWAFDN
jgi:hypothetical protein